MGRTSDTEKLAKKRSAWTDRTASFFDISKDEAAALLATERRQSLRLNPLKANPAQTLRTLRANGFHGSLYEWMPDGYHIDSSFAAARDSDVVTSGAAYIQNAASWLPVLALDLQSADKVLDVCAAPGGKTSHIAAATNNKAHIWANDNSKPRLARLRANCERLNAHVEQFTLHNAEKLAYKLEEASFDKILIDAPCSAEGQRNIQNDKDVMGWSVAHIKRLQRLQKRIITQAWQLLKPGGTLVYSTCTMAPEENEAVIDYLLRRQPDATVQPFRLDLPNRTATVASLHNKTYDQSISQCLRLRPSADIEAFFVCKIQKALH